MAYLTVAELKPYLRHERGSVDDALLSSILDTVSASIDAYCGRSFVAYGGGGATARSYAPTGTTVLFVHDCTTVSSITEDGTTLSSTYWQAEPVNSLDDGGATVPYHRIRRIDGMAWTQTSAYPGKASISVTATWGWSAVPSRVKDACRIMAKDLADQQNVRGGLIDFGEFGAPVTQNRMAVQLLAPLRMVRSWGVA